MHVCMEKEKDEREREKRIREWEKMCVCAHDREREGEREKLNRVVKMDKMLYSIHFSKLHCEFKSQRAKSFDTFRMYIIRVDSLLPYLLL